MILHAGECMFILLSENKAFTEYLAVVRHGCIGDASRRPGDKSACSGARPGIQMYQFEVVWMKFGITTNQTGAYTWDGTWFLEDATHGSAAASRVEASSSSMTLASSVGRGESSSELGASDLEFVDQNGNSAVRHLQAARLKCS